MKPHDVIWCCSMGLLPLSLGAQQVTVTYSTAAPLQTAAYSHSLGQLQQQSVPANAVGPQFLHPMTQFAEASSTYGFIGNDSTWQMRTDVYEAAPSAAIANGEMLIEVTATSPVAARVDLLHSLTLSAGSQGPAFRIDFGDDGVVDVRETSTFANPFFVTLGPAPVRIRMAASLVQFGAGSIDLRFGIAVSPAQTQVVPLLPGCGGVPLYAGPTFEGNGVRFEWPSVPAVVLVIGVGLQPTPLPFAVASSCVLVPTPDLLVAPAPPAYGYTLPLPAALRPAMLFAQAVNVMSNCLAASNSFMVQAY